MIALSGSKLHSDSGDHPVHLRVRAGRRAAKWRRLLVLMPALALLSLFFVAAAEYDRLDIAGASTARAVAALKGKVLAALQDPLAFLDQRSPGRRTGAQRLTKSRPHERVLSQVRTRPPIPALAPPLTPPLTRPLTPSVEGPAFAENGPALAPPANTIPEELFTGPQNGAPTPSFFETAPGFSGFPVTTVGNSGNGTTPPGGGGTTPPGGGGTTPPGSGGTTPPGGGGTTPPGGGGTTPPGGGGTPVTALPEPATWALMIFGLLAIFATMRWHDNKRTALPAFRKRGR